ncbi:protein NPAT [Striga asiatica]|uniref:Protein NPAT n=1 Tax=Striga asiatica TaxID=4170 RepID=A0A5A7Q2I3_STRAF|nr:protein NPAT [Striga asiatica]
MSNSKNQREVPHSSLIRLRTEWQPRPERKCDVSGNSGSTPVSGLNFDSYFFLHIYKGSKARFLLPLLIDQGPPAVVSVTHRGSLSSVFLVLENGRHLPGPE